MDVLVRRLVHRAHTALPERPYDAVVAEALAELDEPCLLARFTVAGAGWLVWHLA